MLRMINNIKVTMSNKVLDVPHLVASYGNDQGTFSLQTGKLIQGHLPREQAREIEFWILENEKVLLAEWEKLTNH